MHRPGVAAAKTARATCSRVSGVCPYAPGPNQAGSRGPGPRDRRRRGWSEHRLFRGRPGPGARRPHDPLLQPLGGFQCKAPQAESDVMVLDATSNGSLGISTSR